MGIQVYQELARTIIALKNCQESGNSIWEERHGENIKKIVCDFLPHGSGFDNEPEVDIEASMKRASGYIVIHASYHVMDDSGMYDRWIDFIVRVIPSLSFGCSVCVTGKFGKYPELREYIADTYSEALDNVLTETVIQQ